MQHYQGVGQNPANQSLLNPLPLKHQNSGTKFRSPTNAGNNSGSIINQNITINYFADGRTKPMDAHQTQYNKG